MTIEFSITHTGINVHAIEKGNLLRSAFIPFPEAKNLDHVRVLAEEVKRQAELAVDESRRFRQALESLGKELSDE